MSDDPVRDDEEWGGADASPAPCRLFVYLAREAPLAVVLRRGPSAWARLSLWHTDTDTFEHGQWFAGRVYERRCDVSPDGSLFVYFARKSTGRVDLEVDSWAAISRPPWFTALALWGVGSTYFTGGFFVSATSLIVNWITGPPEMGALPPWLALTKEAPYLDRTPDWPDRMVYINRLLRDGWTPRPSIDDPTATWERSQPAGPLTLTMTPVSDASFQTYGGRHVDEFAVLSPSGEVQALGPARWADWDQRGRLLLARDGKLLEWRDGGGLREIADLNAQTPHPAPSPPEARVWPRLL